MQIEQGAQRVFIDGTADVLQVTSKGSNPNIIRVLGTDGEHGPGLYINALHPGHTDITYTTPEGDKTVTVQISAAVSATDPQVPPATPDARFEGATVASTATTQQLTASFNIGIPMRAGYKKSTDADYTFLPFEPSDTYNVHNPALVTGLDPNTEYDWVIQIPEPVEVPATAGSNWTTVGAITEKTNPQVTGRDAFWANVGLNKIWEATPDASELGQLGSTWFNAAKFTNGRPLLSRLANGQTYKENEEPLSSGQAATTQMVFIENAPDGIPSVRVTSEGGNFKEQLNVIGNQVDVTAITQRRAVFSFERIIAPGTDLSQNADGGRYAGAYTWHGDADAQANGELGGGSTNFENSMTYRVVKAAQGYTSANRDQVYFYPARDDTDTSPGDTTNNTTPAVAAADQGTVELIELHIIPNEVTTEGANNPPDTGQINLYIDGVLSASEQHALVRFSSVAPGGFGLFVQMRNAVSQTVYLRNFKIYIG